MAPTKSEDVEPLIRLGLSSPALAFPAIRELAADPDWRVREVAATVLVRLSKKHPGIVLSKMKRWCSAADPNVRRASSEGLRGLVRIDPRAVLPVLARLRHDPSRVVQKSVANLLRDASKNDPEFVARTCRGWRKGATDSTRWIVRHGIQKLQRKTQREILAELTD